MKKRQTFFNEAKIAAALQQRLARDFTNIMTEFHETDLTCGDETIRDAVIVKTVALTVLAFGIPATRDGVLDYDEAMRKLKSALLILRRKGTEGEQTLSHPDCRTFLTD